MSESKYERAIKGNIKKRPDPKTTNIHIDKDIKAKMDKLAKQEEINNLQYITMVFKHYWECKKDI